MCRRGHTSTRPTQPTRYQGKNTKWRDFETDSASGWLGEPVADAMVEGKIKKGWNKASG